MQILITGGYGFIGSFLGARLHQEGHQLFVIDNLSTGSPADINFKHRCYQINVEDEVCEEVFKNNHFDVLIHLAARRSQGLEGSGARVEASANLVGLVNMLELAAKYRVKKFLFVSSAEVYGANPELPWKEEQEARPTSGEGVSKLAGELYCKQWAETRGLEVVILRLASVYGPRRHWREDETGLINQAIIEQRVDWPGSPDLTRDFIYISDAVDAIYRAIENNVSRVLNISSNRETSMAELVAALKWKINLSEVNFATEKKPAVNRMRLDNTRAKQELDWIPLFSLGEGISETIDWYDKAKPQPWHETTFIKDVLQKAREIKHLAYIENGIAFLITVLLTWVTKLGSEYSILDVKLIYIIMMGTMYGMVQALIASILSIILFISVSLAVGIDLISLISDPNNIIQIILYTMVGLYIGYTTERRNREILIKERRLQDLEKRFNFLTEINNEARQVKEELQSQIINFEDSYGKIYNMVKEIDSLEPEHILNASVSLLENVMETDTVSIYIVNPTGQYLRLVAKSKSLNVANSLIINDIPELKTVISTKDVFVNKSLKPLLPMMMAPILEGDQVVAIVGINNVRFESFTLYHQNLFKVVIGLISACLLKASKYAAAIADKRFINGTVILKQDSFKRIVELKLEAKERTKLNYSIIQIKEFDLQDQELLSQVVNTIRQVDYIGDNGNGDGISILLSNADQQEAELIVARLKKKKIMATVVPEGRTVN